MGYSSGRVIRLLAGGAILIASLLANAQDIISSHAFSADELTASYDGGWVQNPSTRLPGMSENFPPHLPPTVEFAMFSTVYEIPFHYDNPVSGRH